MILFLIFILTLNLNQTTLCIDHHHETLSHYHHSELEHQTRHCDDHHCIDLKINQVFHRDDQVAITIPLPVMLPQPRYRIIYRPLNSRLIDGTPGIRPPPKPFFHQQHIKTIKTTIIRS